MSKINNEDNVAVVETNNQEELYLSFEDKRLPPKFKETFKEGVLKSLNGSLLHVLGKHVDNSTPVM